MGVTFAYAAEITKSERDANGDLIVYGKATGPDLDLDGQIADPAWLKSAMPGWMEWGNVREMHQPVAAGIGVELESIGDDWWLKSKCIDPNTAKKIEEGVLKGYSIGIKNAKVVKDAAAPGGRIVGGTIVETSYVDRPCNPTAKMTICKRAGHGLGSDPLRPVEVDDPGVAEPPPTTEDVTVVDTAPVPGGIPDAEGEGPGKDQPTGEITEKGSGSTPSNAGSRLGRSLAAQVRKLVPSLATLDKAAPAEDIADAQAAIAAVARLIMGEAESLAAGDMADAYQISILLDAICALKWFIECESTETAMTPAGMVTVELDAKPEVTKNNKAKDAGESKNIEDLVKTAIAEAREADSKRIEALEAELAKALQRPVPGGPVLTRSLGSIGDAEKRTEALTKASEYDRLAVEMRGVDSAVAAGYAKMAAEARALAGVK